MAIPSWDWKWLLTSLVAVYGALLSTWNAWSAHRANKPKIRVLLNIEIIEDNSSEYFETQSINVIVQNHGLKDVSFGPDCLRVGIRDVPAAPFRPYPSSSKRFPVQLQPGTDFRLTCDVRDCRESLTVVPASKPLFIRALVHDQLDRQFKSDFQRLNIVEDRRRPTERPIRLDD